MLKGKGRLAEEVRKLPTISLTSSPAQEKDLALFCEVFGGRPRGC